MHPYNLITYKRVLQDRSTDDLKVNPLNCSCLNSPFNYGIAGQVISGDLIIVENEAF